MTEYILALVPQYGVYLIFGVVFIACLGIPLPSSVVVLTSGALAASGDLSIVLVITVVFVAYIMGDQIAFAIGRSAGSSLIQKLKSSSTFKTPTEKSEALLEKHGLFAVFLSRTVISPTGPFVGYLSGAVKLSWARFTATAVSGAAIWTCVYASMGYFFAGELPQVSDLVAAFLIFSVALLVSIALLVWLIFAWRRFEPTQLNNIT